MTPTKNSESFALLNEKMRKDLIQGAESSEESTFPSESAKSENEILSEDRKFVTSPNNQVGKIMSPQNFFDLFTGN